ncbi:MAG: DNA methyltransferase [Xanthobacteraceae bacterium]
MAEVDNQLTALNAICPYFTMFPLQFPLSVIRRVALARRELVFDPFCGRGTTNFAARLLGVPSFGIDSSRVAVAATAAKLVNGVAPADIVTEAKLILGRRHHVECPSGMFWRLAYRPTVLKDICKLRQDLLSSCRSDVRKALRGIVLGALHGPLKKDGSSSYFSNQSPRTFAPKPKYAVRFWREKGFRAPDVSSLEVISERAQWYYHRVPSKVRNRVRCGDARSRSFVRTICDEQKPTLIITSPAYYGLRTYVPDQWLRNWFVGGPAHVDYSYGVQLSHRSLELFIADLRKVWLNVADVSDNRARLVFRFGAINDRALDPRDVISQTIQGTPWRLRTIVHAGTARLGKRQLETFVRGPEAPIIELDAWAARE